MQWNVTSIVCAALCICCCLAGNAEQHQHDHIQVPQQLNQQRNNKTTVIGNDIHHRRKTSEYRAAPGEILAKDSILYSHKPGTRQLRRQLWPIMEEIANSVAVGAKMIKQMVRPDKDDYYRQQKARTIKNVYLTPSSTILLPTISTHPLKSYMKPFKMIRPFPTRIIDQKPVRTISEDYVLHFNNNPNYVLKSAPKKVNPFTDMGVTGYKHFEDTVLRELEQKEEAKVESTMKTLQNVPKIHHLEEQLISGVPYGGWKPVKPKRIVALPTTEKPKVVSKLHTSTAELDVKPVHEEVDEAAPIKVINGELTKSAPIQQQKSTNISPSRHKHLAKEAVASASGSTASASAPATSTFKPIIVADVPNYPEHFLKRQHQKSKVAKQTSERKKPVKALASTAKPISIEMQASHQTSVFVTPLIPVTKLEAGRTRRLKTQRVVDAMPSGAAQPAGRGTVRFGDSQ